jgi:copper chaperone
MTEITLNVSGMTCMGCVSSVRRLLGQLPGVHDVDVDLASGRVRVGYDAQQVGEDRLRQAITEGGYQVAA